MDLEHYVSKLVYWMKSYITEYVVYDIKYDSFISNVLEFSLKL